MKSKFDITEAELPLMNVLWAYGEMTSPELFTHIDGNLSTLKTLLNRLVQKGSIKTTPINSRTFRYRAAVSKKAYINHERKGFLDRLFDGSKQKMLLNFVREENISKQDIERLFEMIEEEE